MGHLKLILVLSFILYFPAKSLATREDEEFSEALLLRPLPDRKVLAHFQFESRVPPTRTHGHHHHLFPKSIYQLVHKFRVREMELSFTQGRWNYESWGGFDPISSSNAKPPGVELWATFDVPQHQVDASWKNLTHALSGLFCASINFLEHSTTYSAPEWSFRAFSGNLRYGTLPREAVCTENITPWLKLLPCRDKAGLSTLMDRPSIYGGFYHSQRLHLKSNEFDLSISGSGIVLEQTLSVVLRPTTLRTGVKLSSGSVLQPTWSISSLFGRKATGKCSLSKSASIYIQLDQNFVADLERQWKESDGSQESIPAYEGSWNNPSFELSISPDKVIKEIGGSSVLFEYSVANYSDLNPLDLGFKWKVPTVWSCQQTPLHANRFLMGSGNERGAIAISLRSTDRIYNTENSSNIEEGCQLRVHVFQVVPWYVKVYYHTLKVFLDEELQYAPNIVENMRVSPSEDKVSPGMMEMILRLPCTMNSAAVTLEFDKGFLHIDEYPPDANQGFDIPSAIVSFPDSQVKLSLADGDSLSDIPILSKLQEQNVVQLYTEVLLVPLTTPDFSMPYNVITITCTVFALYFGSLLNVLRRRVAEEERLLKSRARKTSKLGQLLSKFSAKLRGKTPEPPKESSSSSSSLNYKLIFKVILVAGIAAAWQYFFR